MKKLQAESKLLLALAVLLFVILAAGLNHDVRAQGFPEYQNYVHTFMEPLQNWTYIEKPVFPILFNDSQIGIGHNWSIVCPLLANHSYHAYCYGKWVNNGSDPQTDYDIYVYNPLGDLEGYHTESAGLPEHLGTTVDESFFVPEYSGNYTFVIVNDARESSSSQQATFMLVEDVECNVWGEHYVEGKASEDLPLFNTSWAYEFITDSQHVEVWVEVPKSLDMYEVRLYLMSDPKSQGYALLNGAPLAWELGLYGDKVSTDGGLKYGGYNLESQEYRGVAYASCEYYGQEMFLNLTSPHVGKSLYHLVLIGEAGNGTVEFLVKTKFGTAGLVPSIVPTRVLPQNETVVAYVSNSTDLLNATLQYSTKGWANVTALPMEILDNRTCRASVPGQEAGTQVVYRVEANDILKNTLTANGSYSVKFVTSLNLTQFQGIHAGENITVRGLLTPAVEDIPVAVLFTSGNETRKIETLTGTNGTFEASFQTENVGVWEVQAEFDGNQLFYPSLSPSLTVRVEEPTFLMKYSLYLGGGAVGAAIAGIVVYVKKFRD